MWRYVEIKRYMWLQEPRALGGAGREAWRRGPGPPTESSTKAPDSQDISIRVCTMFTMKGRPWTELRIKCLPEQMGDVPPITASFCSEQKAHKTSKSQEGPVLGMKLQN